MKKIVLVVVAVMCIFALVACSADAGSTEAAATESTETAAAVEETAMAEAEATEETEAAAGEESAGDTVQVGIVLPTKDEPRWIQDESRFASILETTGFTYQVLFSQGSSATEKTNVESLISKGMEVLIICPQDTAAVAATVETAADAGVTVISYDRLITGTEKVDYIVGFDSKPPSTEKLLVRQLGRYILYT